VGLNARREYASASVAGSGLAPRVADDSLEESIRGFELYGDVRQLIGVQERRILSLDTAIAYRQAEAH
jgi:hypothetical protein